MGLGVPGLVDATRCVQERPVRMDLFLALASRRVLVTQTLRAVREKLQ